jgi:hypothetical protein
LEFYGPPLNILFYACAFLQYPVSSTSTHSLQLIVISSFPHTYHLISSELLILHWKRQQCSHSQRHRCSHWRDSVHFFGHCSKFFDNSTLLTAQTTPYICRATFLKCRAKSASGILQGNSTTLHSSPYPASCQLLHHLL